jgi:hypothetical protein
MVRDELFIWRGFFVLPLPCPSIERMREYVV